MRAGGFIFVLGQLPTDPETMQFVEGDIAVQTERVLENIRVILQAAGADFSHVVRATVYLADMNDFATVNEVYARYVGDAPPARVAVQVALAAAGMPGSKSTRSRTSARSWCSRTWTDALGVGLTCSVSG